MQSVSSRIWTRVAVSISYDDNHYTTGTSLNTKSKITVVNIKTKKVIQEYLKLAQILIISGTIYPTPPLGQDMTQGQFLSGV